MTDPVTNDAKIKKPSFRWIPIDRLRPYGNNPRKHSEEQIQFLMHSLSHFGWGGAIKIQKGTNVVIGGHGTLEAAKRLGLKQAPCLELDHDQNEAGSFRFTDNKSAEMSAWDDRLVNLELVELDGAGVNLGITGFSDAELKERIAANGMPGTGMPPVQPVGVEKKSVTCPRCGNIFDPDSDRAA